MLVYACSCSGILLKARARRVKFVKKKISSDLLRGHTDTIVLGILLKGDSYGYQIHKTIKEKTNEQFELKEKTLYSSTSAWKKMAILWPIGAMNHRVVDENIIESLIKEKNYTIRISVSGNLLRKY